MRTMNTFIIASFLNKYHLLWNADTAEGLGLKSLRVKPQLNRTVWCVHLWHFIVKMTSTSTEKEEHEGEHKGTAVERRFADFARTPPSVGTGAGRQGQGRLKAVSLKRAADGR